MKKLLLFLIIALVYTSCSNDNCAQKRADIMKQYEQQLELYKDNPERLQQIKDALESKLANAC